MPDGRLWLYRTKPQDDELFSSWLVRLAHGLAVKLQTFSVQMLGLSSGFWTGDVDRHPDRSAIECLSEGAAVLVERIAMMGLSAYEGFLWESYRPRGLLPWVMPIGRFGRRRHDYGQQFCRQCLLEDEKPYFRRRWRLAFNILCERHKIFLDDACRCCKAPVEFHAGDFGRRLLDFECPITRCGVCGGDFRIGNPDLDYPAPAHLIEFQSRLNAALQGGCSTALPGAGNYSFLLFDGLRYLVHLLASRSRGARLRNLMLACEGQLGLDVSARRFGPLFEELRIGDRVEILGWCRGLLKNWPTEFIQLCQKSRVSSSYILRYDAVAPYWLAAEVSWYLDDRDYGPTNEEREAVVAYLSRQGLPVNANIIRHWLGVAHNPGRNFRKFRQVARWNPRGPASGEII